MAAVEFPAENVDLALLHGLQASEELATGKALAASIATSVQLVRNLLFAYVAWMPLETEGIRSIPLMETTPETPDRSTVTTVR